MHCCNSLAGLLLSYLCELLPFACFAFLLLLLQVFLQFICYLYCLLACFPVSFPALFPDLLVVSILAVCLLFTCFLSHMHSHHCHHYSFATAPESCCFQVMLNNVCRYYTFSTVKAVQHTLDSGQYHPFSRAAVFHHFRARLLLSYQLDKAFKKH